MPQQTNPCSLDHHGQWESQPGSYATVSTGAFETGMPGSEPFCTTETLAVKHCSQCSPSFLLRASFLKKAHSLLMKPKNQHEIHKKNHEQKGENEDTYGDPKPAITSSGGHSHFPLSLPSVLGRDSINLLLPFVYWSLVKEFRRNHLFSPFSQTICPERCLHCLNYQVASCISSK
jgi:hypothetical protein